MDTARTRFPKFYSHPLIQELSCYKRWTISTNNKIPVDMCVIRDYKRIAGAKYQDERSLVTLDEVLDIIPCAANHAFFLDCVDCNYVVLDIEPKCPDEIKKQLLNLNYIYGEISMSGKGYHSVFPLPKSYRDYPVLQTKKVLKEEHGFFEILLNHYVTFTRKMLPDATGKADFDDLFKSMAQVQKETIRNDNITFENANTEPDIPHRDELISVLNRVTLKKSFDGDYSRYEFSYAKKVYCTLQEILTTVKPYKNIEYNATQKAWLIYIALKNILEYRPKHDSLRNGVPWLLFVAQEVIIKS